ncbi:hypothetical protein ACVHNB_15820 [Streptomyces sp. YJ-C3]
MASYSQDPRCTALAEAVEPLLRRSSPPDADGYGGCFQLVLASKDSDQLGGPALIRAALRVAACRLDWRVSTYGFDRPGASDQVLLGIEDKRPVPRRYAEIVRRERDIAVRAAINASPGAVPRGSSRPAPLRGTPAVQSQEFLASVADRGLLK